MNVLDDEEYAVKTRTYRDQPKKGVRRREQTAYGEVEAGIEFDPWVQGRVSVHR
jgi:hypothetical protein